MRCPNCHSETSENSKFCIACGAALERYCLRCGVDNLPQARFCGHCGSSFAEAATSPIGEAARPDLPKKRMYQNISTMTASAVI
jgi:uncharacterized membrane protein YvbJ